MSSSFNRLRHRGRFVYACGLVLATLLVSMQTGYAEEAKLPIQSESSAVENATRKLRIPARELDTATLIAEIKAARARSASARAAEKATNPREPRSTEHARQRVREFLNDRSLDLRKRKEIQTQADVPAMIDMLNDDNYGRDWWGVAGLLGPFDSTGESQVALIEFVQRDNLWIEGADVIETITAKSWAIKSLGIIGKERGIDFIKSMLSRDGAAAAADAWLYELLPQSYDIERMLHALRSSAAEALVFSQQPENIQLVEELHAETIRGLKVVWERVQRDGNMDSMTEIEHSEVTFKQGLGDVLGKRDYIADHGLDAYLSLGGEALFDAVGQYAGKYDKGIDEL